MTAANEEIAICQVCGAPINDGPIVTCSSCDTPHHQDCWQYLGHCSTFGCHATRTNQSAQALVRQPEQGEVLFIDENTVSDDLMVGADDMLDQAVDAYSASSMSRPYLRVDLDTPLENFTFWGALASALLSIFLLSTSGEIAALLFVLAIALGLTYSAIDCTYVLDHNTKSVYYLRRLFGFTTRYQVCPYNQVHTVAVNGTRHESKHSTWWNYGVVFVTHSGEVIPVSNERQEDYYRAGQNADILARHLGTRVHKGRLENELIVKEVGGQPYLSYEPYSILNHPFIMLIYVFVAMVWIALMAAH